MGKAQATRRLIYGYTMLGLRFGDFMQIGSNIIIAHKGKCYTATVIDLLHKTKQPKRVRIQNDIELQGKVLFPNQYTYKCETETED